MNQHSPSLQEQMKLNEICDAFESAWKSGPVPDQPLPNLVNFVGDLSGSLRAELLQELILLDLFHRDQNQLPRADYSALFPDDAEALQRALEQHASSSGGVGTARMGGQNKTGADSPLLQAGERASRFSILRAHAQGGLGKVYVALDQELQREVAFKQMLDSVARYPECKDRFVKEAIITGQLEHPNIVPIYSLAADASGAPYYAMRFIQGHSLASEITDVHSSRRASRGPKPTVFAPPKQPENAGQAEAASKAVSTEELAVAMATLVQEKTPTRQAGPVAAHAKELTGATEITAEQPANAGVAEDDLKNPAGVVPPAKSGFPPADRSQAAATDRAAAKDRAARSTFDSLEFRQLLTRFVAICQAVEFAHQRGVIHRDIKPANIMLGAFGESLLVDWGLARLVSPAAEAATSAGAGPGNSADTSASAAMHPAWRIRVTNAAKETELGAVIGTPAYMSPEQALGDVQRLGPASDIYSLGATLYEMLTDRRPFTGNVQQVLEKVRAGSFAAPRAIEPAVPRALEAICLKAMALRPEERYASAQAMAHDLERYLADEPVSALVESWPTRTRRWLRKHPTATTAASLLVVVGLLFSVVVAMQERIHIQAIQSKNGQLNAQNEKLDQSNRELVVAKSLAEHERDQTQGVLKYLVNMFRITDPRLEGNSLTVARALDLAARAAKRDQELDIKTRARLLEEIGRSYSNLKLPMSALPVLEAAVELSTTANGAGDMNTLRCKAMLGAVYADAGQHQRAIALLEETVAQTRTQFGDDHDLTLSATTNLGVARNRSGDVAQAFSHFEEVRQLLEQRPDTDRSKLANLQNLAMALKNMGDLKNAIPLLERVWQVQHSQNMAEQCITQSNLGSCLLDNGQQNEAIDHFKEALVNSREWYGPDSQQTLLVLNNLAAAYQQTGQSALSIPLLEEALTGLRKNLGDKNSLTLSAIGNLAMSLEDAGQLEKSIPLYQEAARGLRATLGENHRSTLTADSNLAIAMLANDNVESALPLFEEIASRYANALGQDHPETLVAESNLATVQGRAQRFAEAAATLESVVPRMQQARGRSHPGTLLTMGSLADTYRQMGETQKQLAVAQSILDNAWDKPAMKLPEIQALVIKMLTLLEADAQSHGSAEEAARLQTMRASLENPGQSGQGPGQGPM